MRWLIDFGFKFAFCELFLSSGKFGDDIIFVLAGDDRQAWSAVPGSGHGKV